VQVSEKSYEVRNLIGGSWEIGNGRETEPVYDPATGQTIAETPLSTKEDVDRAVKAASAAFTGWAATPVIQRIQVMFRYKMLLEEHFEELRDLVTLENGKDARDAGGEVRRGDDECAGNGDRDANELSGGGRLSEQQRRDPGNDRRLEADQ